VSLSTKKKQDRTALRKRRANRRFAFLKQLRRDTDLSSSAKLVVWSLADDSYNLDDERCNPGFAAIGANVGRTGRQAKRCIKEAQDAGWITFTSTSGGKDTCTNRYTLVWEKIANPTTDTASEGDTQSADVDEHATQDTPSPAESPDEPPDVTPGDTVEDGEYTEIVEEPETEGGHTCPPSAPEMDPEGGHRRSPGGSYMSHEPNLNPEGGRKEGKPWGRRADARALLKREDEQAFQKLCEMWSVRDVFHGEGDMVKSRNAFAAMDAEHGDRIRAESGVQVGDYMLDRANVWITEIDTAQRLPKLECWLGVEPGFKGNVEQWWQRRPRQFGGAYGGGKSETAGEGIMRRAGAR
jgi:hypothetical protein